MEGTCSIGIGNLPGLSWRATKHIVQQYVEWRDSHMKMTGSYINIYIFTIDDADKMTWLIKSGVDGMITNKPHLLSEVYEKYAKQNLL